MKMFIKHEDVSIYKSWNSDVIDKALFDFADNMRGDNDYNTEDLSNGVLGLDFICFKSDLNDAQRNRYDSLLMESEMRIHCMNLKSENILDEQYIGESIKLLDQFSKQVKNLQRRMKSVGEISTLISSGFGEVKNN